MGQRHTAGQQLELTIISNPSASSNSVGPLRNVISGYTHVNCPTCLPVYHYTTAHYGFVTALTRLRFSSLVARKIQTSFACRWLRLELTSRKEILPPVMN